MTFGQPDEEGWFYALTFDRLSESLKQKRAIGQSSKMLVRRRRHVSYVTYSIHVATVMLLFGYTFFRSLIIIIMIDLLNYIWLCIATSFTQLLQCSSVIGQRS